MQQPPPNWQQPSTQYPPQQPPYPQQWQPPMMPPQQPPRKKRSPWLILALILGVLVLVGVIGNAISTSHGQTSAHVTATALPTGTPAPTDTPTQAPSAHFKVGETARTADGYIVTVNKTYTSAGGEFSTPTSGNQYLLVDVSVKNTTGQVQHMASIQFTLTDSTGQAISNTVVSLPNLHLFLGGTLQDGATMRGVLAYEVPTGKHPYTLAFAGNSFSDAQTFWDITT